MSELNAAQFNLIKNTVESGVFMIILPDVIESDALDIKEKHNVVLTDLKQLVTMGFLEDIASKFTHMLEEIKSKGLRPFYAFALTELSVKMFIPSRTSETVN